MKEVMHSISEILDKAFINFFNFEYEGEYQIIEQDGQLDSQEDTN